MRLSQDLKRIVAGELPLDFNWNNDYHPLTSLPLTIPSEPTANQLQKVIIDDESLRDGLHGVSDYPGLEAMMRYIKAANAMKITLMTVGIYSGTGIVSSTTKKILKRTALEYPKVMPIILSMATKESLDWAFECSKLNPKLQVLVFMGSAPSRMLVEGWSKSFVLHKLAWAVRTAVKKYKLLVIGATEHTTQTPPDFLQAIIETQVKNGAKFFCIADTIGCARPRGVYRIVKFVKKVLRKIKAKNILIDWHGHRDMGLSMANAMTAIAAGAQRIHLVPWGIGERAGNAPLEKFIINTSQILKDKGCAPRWNLSNLSFLLNTYAEITNNDISYHGCLGKRAFFTSLGIHTAAILKAEKLAQEAEIKGYKKLSVKLREMARKIYAGVDPYLIGRKYRFGIGPFSGSSTVKLWAISHDFQKPSKAKIIKVLETAKGLRRSLTEKEIIHLLNIKSNKF